VIILFVTGKITDIEPDHPGNTPFLWHGSLGVLVFLLVIARVVWAFVSPVPALPGTMTRVARLSARSMHVLLYALLLSVPLSGWLVSSSEGASVNFFGVVSIPKWASRESQPPTATAQKADEELLEEVHEVLGNALVILAGLHALVALKHHFFNRDDVLNRMLPKSDPPRRPPAVP
jgi:cytochrome b561